MGAKTRRRRTNGWKTERSGSCGEVLHDDGAQECERERTLEKA
jgi:hypothetical protein